ncbi:DUF1918 domain-containing protein [Streptomyces sp. NBC_01077]|uniref:DUF1918 domain-containing protein n=1 Tax=Streptomyces sp. NBC_01077 TaxID=2903746 RepID=UPI0038649C84|nr:DUF1918 domain-containing protein [Streptomyces sp. NBC_01077]WSV43724.1 DUF1918 domain-containing protein [Streptomyces sp. NBC_01077]
MRVNVGDVLRFTSHKVGTAEHHAEVLEVLGAGGEPPYRVRYDDGRETEIFPGVDCVLEDAVHLRSPHVD